MAPGAKSLSEVTAAEPMLDVVVSDNSGKERTLAQEAESFNIGDTLSRKDSTEYAKPIVLRPYATSFYRQLYYLSGRSFRNFYRNFFLMPIHFAIAILAGLALGAIYWKLNNDIPACQNRIGVLFFVLILLAFGAMSSLDIFLTERAVFVKERANGYYRPLSYFIAKTFFDIIPLRLFPPVFLAAICYYMIGLNPWFYKWVIFTIILVLFNIVAGALCIAIGSIVKSSSLGNVIAIVIILIAALFSGYLAQKNSMPVWLGWLKWVSFWNYAFEGLMINEFHGLPVILNPEGFSVSYAADGDFYLLQFGMDFNRLFWDVIILAGWAIIFVILSGVLLIGCVREKR
jgi:ABC-type multidrug transport system permease subunit